jgi:hypothetical protein
MRVKENRGQENHRALQHGQHTSPEAPVGQHDLTEKAPLTFNNNLNEVIRENIEARLRDDAFIKRIN